MESGKNLDYSETLPIENAGSKHLPELMDESNFINDSMSGNTYQAETPFENYDDIETKHVVFEKSRCVKDEKSMDVANSDVSESFQQEDFANDVSMDEAQNELVTGNAPRSISLLKQDDDDEEEEDGDHRKRFLRTATDAAEKCVRTSTSWNTSQSNKSKLHGCHTNDQSRNISDRIGPHAGNIIITNLPPSSSAQQIKLLLQAKLPNGVLLHELSTVKDGRAEASVTPVSMAARVVQLLHGITLNGCKIKVIKMITVASDRPAPAGASLNAPKGPRGGEPGQNMCVQHGCHSLVFKGDIHLMCCEHSDCFVKNVFDPASCRYCQLIIAKAKEGDAENIRLWRARIKRMNRKHISWVSLAARNEFFLPKFVSKPLEVKTSSPSVSSTASLQTSILDKNDTVQNDESRNTVTSNTEDESSGITTGECSNKMEVTSTNGEKVENDKIEQQSEHEDSKKQSNEVNMEQCDSAERDCNLEHNEHVVNGVQVMRKRPEFLLKSRGANHRVMIKFLENKYNIKELITLIQDTVGGLSVVVPQRRHILAEFETKEAATECVRLMDKMVIHGRSISVRLCESLATTSTLSLQLQARLNSSSGITTTSGVTTAPVTSAASALTPTSAATDSAPTQLPDNADQESSSTSMASGTFGFSACMLESLNITLPIVKKLHVTNLNSVATAADVRELFSVAGTVATVQHQRDAGTAIVEMGDPVAAVQAISLLHSQYYYNQMLQVRMHRPSASLPVLPKGLQTIGTKLKLVGPSNNEGCKDTTIKQQSGSVVQPLGARKQYLAKCLQASTNASRTAPNRKSNLTFKTGLARKPALTSKTGLAPKAALTSNPASTSKAASNCKSGPDRVPARAAGPILPDPPGKSYRPGKIRRGGGPMRGGVRNNDGPRKNPYWSNYTDRVAGVFRDRTGPGIAGSQAQQAAEGMRYGGRNYSYGTTASRSNSDSAGSGSGQYSSSSQYGGDWMQYNPSANTSNSGSWNPAWQHSAGSGSGEGYSSNLSTGYTSTDNNKASTGSSRHTNEPTGYAGTSSTSAGFSVPGPPSVASLLSGTGYTGNHDTGYSVSNVTGDGYAGNSAISGSYSSNAAGITTSYSGNTVIGASYSDSANAGATDSSCYGHTGSALTGYNYGGDSSMLGYTSYDGNSYGSGSSVHNYANSSSVHSYSSSSGAHNYGGSSYGHSASKDWAGAAAGAVKVPKYNPDGSFAGFTDVTV